MDVVALSAARGQERYGESVTLLEHALQCAALARRERADDEVVLAALLHDVGHLVTEAPEAPDGHHGHEGAKLLRPWVPARIAWLVEHHVVAKRYLCTVNPRYARRLSDASVRSLAAQGPSSISSSAWRSRRGHGSPTRSASAGGTTRRRCPIAYRPLIERWLGAQSWRSVPGIA